MRAQTHQIGGVRPTTFAIPAGFADDTTHVRPDVGPHTVSVDEYLGQHNAEANTLRTLRSRLRYATEGPALDGAGGFRAALWPVSAHLGRPWESCPGRSGRATPP